MTRARRRRVLLLAAALLPFAPAAVSQPAAAPSEPQVRRLVLGTMERLSTSLRKGDATPFHQAAARAWRQRYTPDQTRVLLSEWFDRGVRLDWVSRASLTFSKRPAVGSDGRLVAAGTLSGGDRRIRFELKYQREEGAWRLSAFDLKLL